jgi:hypothetical protein
MSRPFPRALAGQEVDGQCLVILDADAAACITTLLSGRRAPALDVSRLRILSECAASLARICPQLPEEHRVYFDDLREISEHVVTLCRRGSDETRNTA